MGPGRGAGRFAPLGGPELARAVAAVERGQHRPGGAGGPAALGTRLVPSRGGDATGLGRAVLDLLVGTEFPLPGRRQQLQLGGRRPDLLPGGAPLLGARAAPPEPDRKRRHPRCRMAVPPDRRSAEHRDRAFEVGIQLPARGPGAVRAGAQGIAGGTRGMAFEARGYLIRQFDTAWKLTRIHLDGLTTEECLWRPAEKGPHVHRVPDGTWRADWPEHEGHGSGGAAPAPRAHGNLARRLAGARGLRPRTAEHRVADVASRLLVVDGARPLGRPWDPLPRRRPLARRRRPRAGRARPGD